MDRDDFDAAADEISEDVEIYKCFRCGRQIQVRCGNDVPGILEVIQDHLEQCLPSGSDQPGPSSSSGIDPMDMLIPLQPRRTWSAEDDRRKRLEEDPDAYDVGPHSVTCGGCHRPIRLNATGRYYAANWNKHKMGCKNTNAVSGIASTSMESKFNGKVAAFRVSKPHEGSSRSAQSSPIHSRTDEHAGPSGHSPSSSSRNYIPQRDAAAFQRNAEDPSGYESSPDDTSVMLRRWKQALASDERQSSDGGARHPSAQRPPPTRSATAPMHAQSTFRHAVGPSGTHAHLPPQVAYPRTSSSERAAPTPVSARSGAHFGSSSSSPSHSRLGSAAGPRVSVVQPGVSISGRGQIAPPQQRMPDSQHRGSNAQQYAQQHRLVSSSGGVRPQHAPADQSHGASADDRGPFDRFVSSSSSVKGKQPVASSEGSFFSHQPRLPAHFPASGASHRAPVSDGYASDDLRAQDRRPTRTWQDQRRPGMAEQPTPSGQISSSSSVHLPRRAHTVDDETLSASASARTADPSHSRNWRTSEQGDPRALPSLSTITSGLPPPRRPQSMLPPPGPASAMSAAGYDLQRSAQQLDRNSRSTQENRGDLFRLPPMRLGSSASTSSTLNSGSRLSSQQQQALFQRASSSSDAGPSNHGLGPSGRLSFNPSGVSQRERQSEEIRTQRRSSPDEPSATSPDQREGPRLHPVWKWDMEMAANNASSSQASSERSRPSRVVDDTSDDESDRGKGMDVDEK